MTRDWPAAAPGASGDASQRDAPTGGAASPDCAAAAAPDPIDRIRRHGTTLVSDMPVLPSAQDGLGASPHLQPDAPCTVVRYRQRFRLIAEDRRETTNRGSAAVHQRGVHRCALGQEIAQPECLRTSLRPESRRRSANRSPAILRRPYNDQNLWNFGSAGGFHSRLASSCLRPP
jgi:hypothetical protein